MTMNSATVTQPAGSAIRQCRACGETIQIFGQPDDLNALGKLLEVAIETHNETCGKGERQ